MYSRINYPSIIYIILIIIILMFSSCYRLPKVLCEDVMFYNLDSSYAVSVIYHDESKIYYFDNFQDAETLFTYFKRRSKIYRDQFTRRCPCGK